jgi:uncharacterized protein DUF1761
MDLPIRSIARERGNAMPGIHYLAVFVAAVAAFVASSVYYMVFGKALMALLPAESVAVDMRKVPAWKKAAEFVRGLVVAFVVAWFVAQLEVVDWKGALRFAAFVWLGFPFMILTGSVLWDNRPWKFAAIHSGDWLMKLVLMAVILGTWHK